MKNIVFETIHTVRLSFCRLRLAALRSHYRRMWDGSRSPGFKKELTLTGKLLRCSNEIMLLTYR